MAAEILGMRSVLRADSSGDDGPGFVPGSPTIPFGMNITIEHEGAAENQQPEIRICAGGPALERVDADRADDRADERAAAAEGDPDDGFEGFLGGHFAGVDDADLRDEQRAGEGGDDGADDEDEELEIGGGVAGEEHAVFRIADGALDQAEAGVGEPFAAGDHGDEQDGGGRCRDRAGWRRCGGREPSNGAEIGEAVVAPISRSLRKNSRAAP